MPYAYAGGDRLADRNTYFYTAFEGHDFLRAWTTDRDAALLDLGRPAPRAPAAAGAGPSAVAGGFDTAALLERLFAVLDGPGRGIPGEAREGLDLLVQRFEVTKRLHRAYGPNHRAVDRDSFRDLGLYVRFAEALSLAHRRSGDLPYLNALLKCVDTLCSVRADLSAGERARLARVVLDERELVAAVASRAEVAW